MMNFRMAQPKAVIDLSDVAELHGVKHADGAIRIGAMVTHAQLEDELASSEISAFLAQVAQGIAFRAVRNRGTIGGSLAQADPAADWLTALSCLYATVTVLSHRGQRHLKMPELILGPMQVAIDSDEVITEIAVPNAAGTRFGWSKSVRKTGEFAEAIAAARVSSDAAECWIGALVAPAFRIEIAPAVLDGLTVNQRLSGTTGFEWLKANIVTQAPEASPYQVQLAALNASRALYFANSVKALDNDI
jgi:carbon-monoxide dehydrogenase medium subunit